MRGGKTTLWRGGFFFCRFIGLERRVHHDNVLCALARFFSSGYGKRTEQSAIRLLRMAVRWQWRKRAESSADKGLSFQSRQSPKKKITVEITGKTIRGCRDKHQGTYLNGMAHGKFRLNRSSEGQHGRMCSVCPFRLCVHFRAWSLPECLKVYGKQEQTCTADGWAGINGNSRPINYANCVRVWKLNSYI